MGDKDINVEGNKDDIEIYVYIPLPIFVTSESVFCLVKITEEGARTPLIQ